MSQGPKGRKPFYDKDLRLDASALSARFQRARSRGPPPTRHPFARPGGGPSPAPPSPARVGWPSCRRPRFLRARPLHAATAPARPAETRGQAAHVKRRNDVRLEQARHPSVAAVPAPFPASLCPVILLSLGMLYPAALLPRSLDSAIPRSLTSVSRSRQTDRPPRPRNASCTVRQRTFRIRCESVPVWHACARSFRIQRSALRLKGCRESTSGAKRP